jgi:hypothetical protein
MTGVNRGAQLGDIFDWHACGGRALSFRPQRQRRHNNVQRFV